LPWCEFPNGRGKGGEFAKWGGGGAIGVEPSGIGERLVFVHVGGVEKIRPLSELGDMVGIIPSSGMRRVQAEHTTRSARCCPCRAAISASVDEAEQTLWPSRLVHEPDLEWCKMAMVEER
jgi:hypothetical protein